MDVLDAIFTRRTIKDFTAQPVPADAIDRALTAGTWAQNHHLNQPWRFTVLGPETHRMLAAAFGQEQRQSPRNTDEAARETAAISAERKILSKPAIVVVTYPLSDDSQQRREDYAATCCAIQNIQLAAWAEGLGMQWSTNSMTRNPQTYALLGIDPAQEEIVAMLYMGYPTSVPPARPRKPLDEVRRRLA